MNEERFGPAALTLAGVMARALGWPPDDFWAATPADVAAVVAAWRSDESGIDSPALAAMMEQFPDAG